MTPVCLYAKVIVSAQNAKLNVNKLRLRKATGVFVWITCGESGSGRLGGEEAGRSGALRRDRTLFCQIVSLSRLLLFTVSCCFLLVCVFCLGLWVWSVW